MTIRETVRSLEQQETGEIRRLQCAACGQRMFKTLEQLSRHQMVCRRTGIEKADEKN
jgi:hypothetical protein